MATLAHLDRRQGAPVSKHVVAAHGVDRLMGLSRAEVDLLEREHVLATLASQDAALEEACCDGFDGCLTSGYDTLRDRAADLARDTGYLEDPEDPDRDSVLDEHYGRYVR